MRRSETDQKNHPKDNKISDKSQILNPQYFVNKSCISNAQCLYLFVNFVSRR